MVKILRILNRFNLGGPTLNASFLTKHIGDEFETILIGGKHSDYEESSSYILDNENIQYKIIPELQREINLKNDIIAYKKIKEIIKKEHPDIVHTHASKAGILGRLAAIEHNVPIIVHTFHGHIFHSYFSKPKTKLFINLEKYLAKRTSKIITISPLQRQEIKSILSLKANKITTIPIGIDTNKFQLNKEEKRYNFRTQYQLKDTDIAIGIIGRLVPIKNHNLFIKAFSMLKKSFSNTDKKRIKAFIIGDGDLKENLIKLCKNLNLKVWQKGMPLYDADIYFTSWIKDTTDVYHGLDIIALSSLNEGTPVTLIEAQAAGKPVVATDVGGTADTIVSGFSGWLSPSKDVYNFYNNLSNLILNEDLRYKAKNYGIPYVYKKYDYTNLIKNIRQLYLSLLSEKEITKKDIISTIKSKETAFSQ